MCPLAVCMWGSFPSLHTYLPKESSLGLTMKLGALKGWLWRANIHNQAPTSFIVPYIVVNFVSKLRLYFTSALPGHST